MKVVTWNVNGIRARAAQVAEWIAREQPDVLCLQEIKAGPDKIPAELIEALPAYACYWHGHKGYSGVALLVRRAAFADAPVFAHPPFDHETRIVTARLGALLVASIYVPNGGKEYAPKVKFLEELAAFAAGARAAGTRLLLCGDLNVALEERDVHPSLRNDRQIGQTPAERALLANVIAQGLVDLGRRFRPDDDRLFTWWAPWRNMKEKNVGWRLDYVLASESLAGRAQSCESVRAFGTSDHGPVVAVFDLPQPQRAPEPERPPEPQPPPAGQLKLGL